MERGAVLEHFASSKYNADPDGARFPSIRLPSIKQVPKVPSKASDSKVESNADFGRFGAPPNFKAIAAPGAAVSECALKLIVF